MVAAAQGQFPENRSDGRTRCISDACLTWPRIEKGAAVGRFKMEAEIKKGIRERSYLRGFVGGGSGPGEERVAKWPLPKQRRRMAVTADGPRLVHPAFRFAAQQEGKLGAVGDLKRSQTNWAAAIQTRVNLAT